MDKINKLMTYQPISIIFEHNESLVELQIHRNHLGVRPLNSYHVFVHNGIHKTSLKTQLFPVQCVLF